MPDLTLRESTDDDVPALLNVAQKAFRHHTGRPAPWSETGLRRMRLVPGREAGRDFPVVVRDGAVVAWGAVFANPPYSEIFSPLHADPDLADDELAAALALLLDHVDGVAREVVADEPPAPRTRTTEVLSQDVRTRVALERLGYGIDRDEYEMAIDLEGTPPEPEWPPGMTVGALRGPDDADVVVELLADSFAEHPGDLPFSAELVRHVLSGEDLRLGASALVSDAEGPVGLVLCRDRAEAGYVWVLGVRSRARRRGLGHALLRHAFRQYAEAGTTLVTLDVDGSNESGALEVYQRAGMRVRTRNLVLARAFDA
ncbi:MAG TPA: GNAT family N-acetyltransferase [Candidatus Nanopelagicales bacterium]|nr:GNAT family N-acetyltransferase [Candidatus Nanopelagicales bacterium]